MILRGLGKFWVASRKLWVPPRKGKAERLAVGDEVGLMLGGTLPAGFGRGTISVEVTLL